jgi:hypothetical protein
LVIIVVLVVVATLIVIAVLILVISILAVVAILVIVVVIVIVVRISLSCLSAVCLSVPEEVADASLVVVSCIDGPACLPFDGDARCSAVPGLVEVSRSISVAASREE